ncbi:hypothetical protein H2200_008501 [Cladophialophora chaetospira]|uniref:DNA2/NAM7 helicase helicase domain-containing protein n=1 Tax=Cladophialophora chaetospira TaxID=386627 RepID=A0AA38X5W8_9EURO|nr:hypothetical protein H2200_008501 [Cladophialophora chaetospira]
MFLVLTRRDFLIEMIIGRHNTKTIHAEFSHRFPTSATTESHGSVTKVFCEEVLEECQTTIPVGNKATPETEQLYQNDYSGGPALTNDAQRLAIQNAHDYPVSLIHGPPGCAKTTTDVFITESILRRDPKTLILIAAPSNDAADALALSMLHRQQRTGFQFKFTRLRPTAQAEFDMHHKPHDALNDCLFHIQCYQWAKSYQGPSQTFGDYVNGFEEIQKTGNLSRNTGRKRSTRRERTSPGR